MGAESGSVGREGRQGGQGRQGGETNSNQQSAINNQQLTIYVKNFYDYVATEVSTGSLSRSVW